MKPQMIVFGEDWGGLPSSTQHLIKQMADAYQVTWVNSLGLRSPRATLHDVKRIGHKICRQLKQLSQKAQKTKAPLNGGSADQARVNPQGLGQGSADFEVVEPQYIPFPGNFLIRKVNRLLLHRLIKRYGKPPLLAHTPVIWISLPNAIDALHYLADTPLASARVIYYCCDDFSALNGVDHQAIGRLEQELAQRADLIVVTSDDLLAKFPPEKTHMIPHGVDVNLFSQPVVRASDLPSGKPIAGFYGSIAPWIDVPLLAELATLLPQWQFVFIGEVQVDVSALTALTNVTFLGSRPHHQLPGYSQHWQASLLPFHLTDQIKASNPLKLREYLAAGKPVVSVDFPQVRQYQPHVRIADNARSFADALNACLLEGDHAYLCRQQVVAGESWQVVAEQIHQLIVS